MKNSVVLICLLVTVICLQLQAKDKVYEKPYFIARSAQILEVEKVTLKKDTTVLDMRVFSTPTDKVKLLSSAALQSGGKKYSLIKMEGLSAKDWTATNDKGELSFKLFFQALPSKASSFSFINQLYHSERLRNNTTTIFATFFIHLANLFHHLTRWYLL